MTNEEKAEQIAIKICGVPSEYDITGEYPCAEEAALEMAEWKDQQFKEYLEKKRETLYPDSDDECRCCADALIDEIIDELFNNK